MLFPNDRVFLRASRYLYTSGVKEELPKSVMKKQSATLMKIYKPPNAGNLHRSI